MIFRLTSWIFLIAGLIGVDQAWSESAPAAAIDRYFEALHKVGDFSGVVHVQRGEDVLYSRALSGGSSSITTDSGMPVASLTKTFTSAAILTLINDGELTLEDRLSRFLPDFPYGEQITIRMLLLHASGLANVEPESEGAIDSAQLIRRIGELPLLFDPGAESRYSNAGYNVLARVIEVISEQSYGQFIASRFTDLLGMDHTVDGTMLRAEAHRIGGHIPGPTGQVPAPREDDSWNLGSGSLWSSAPDLAQWLMHVASRKEFDVFAQEWPYGWGKTEAMDERGIEQTGLTPGFSSVMQIYPESQLAIVALSNVENGSWASWGKDIATLTFGGSATPKTSPPAKPLSLETRNAVQGVYRGEEWIADIRDQDGFLWAYWNDYPQGKYLKHLGQAQFAIPADIGRIHFLDRKDDRYTRLVWRFPNGGSLELAR